MIYRSRRIIRDGAVRVLLGAALVVAFVDVAAPTGAAPVFNPASVAQAIAMDEDGLNIFTINGAQYGVYTPVHVLTFNDAQYSVKIGLANHAIDGGEQTVGAMCQDTADCVAAVNGDFFDVSGSGHLDPGDEVGGIIRNCVLLHTPEIAHEQVNVNAGSVSNGLNWESNVDVNGTTVPITAINQELPMSYVNVNVPLAGNLLYTSLYDLPTPTAPGRVAYEFTQVGIPTSPTTINTTAELQLVAKTSKALKVPAGRVVISAPMGAALATLQVGDTVTLTTTSTAGCNNIGGHPILFDNGVVGPINRADTYMALPSARTVIGWTSSGETVIMTVGGVDAKSGATMYQLVTMLLSLGVTTALDLDGGGSTTLYANGHVVYPTARTERAVSTSLLVVRSP